ncbi:MAG: SIS domain-containing protein [Candidatus Levybacteria bacterium]|nr:SIS domain-containing protein [Candidatus Levybacteria bacterium]
MAKPNSLYRKKAETHLVESIKVKQLTLEKCMSSILAGAQLIVDTFLSGGKVLLCGNGGSAADCQHMATEFVNALDKNFFRPTMPAFALTTDSSVMTSFSNDFGFDGVFERQVQGLGKPNDLLIGISTSGNSKNVIRAINAANSIKMHTLALTGNNGQLQKIADVVISIPSNNTQYIQEAHLTIEHILCELVEHYLFVGIKKKDLWS